MDNQNPEQIIPNVYYLKDFAEEDHDIVLKDSFTVHNTISTGHDSDHNNKIPQDTDPSIVYEHINQYDSDDDKNKTGYNLLKLEKEKEKEKDNVDSE